MSGSPILKLERVTMGFGGLKSCSDLDLEIPKGLKHPLFSNLPYI